VTNGTAGPVVGGETGGVTGPSSIGTDPPRLASPRGELVLVEADGADGTGESLEGRLGVCGMTGSGINVSHVKNELYIKRKRKKRGCQGDVTGYGLRVTRKL